MSPRPFIVGVAGGTGSGKTTVAERLAELVGEDHLALVKLDSYYWGHDDMAFEARERINYDHPDAFDWPLLIEHVHRLMAGEAVPVPIYDFTAHTRSGESTLVARARWSWSRGSWCCTSPPCGP
ncbi:MAG: hypothetical protein R2715_03400 [Ilumatobacteraceae bacterium]